MIDEGLTFKMFGRCSKDSKNIDSIIAICENCGHDRVTILKNVSKFCMSCSAIFRGHSHKEECLCPFCTPRFGKDNSFFGKKHSEELLITKRGENSNLYIDGRTLEEYQCIECGKRIAYHNWKNLNKICKSCSRRGERNPKYIDGRTPLTISIKNTEEYKEWRESIFKRDDYTCQECGKYGGYLEAHHIKRFSIIFGEFLKEYIQFSLVEDKETLLRIATTYKPFWDLNNGETLCEDCHNLTKGRMLRSL